MAVIQLKKKGQWCRKPLIHILGDIVGSAADRCEELVAIPEKYMLTIREAASYFNIGIKNMRRLCESNEGEFSVRWGNKYLICRPRLEAYLNQLMVRERNKNDVGLEENHGVS